MPTADKRKTDSISRVSRIKALRRFTVAARTQSSLLALTAIAVLFGLVSGSILPSKYFNDSRYIQSIAGHYNTTVPDSSYATTAQVYEFLGLAHNSSLVAILSVSLYAAIVLLALGRRLPEYVSGATLSVIYAALLLAGVYLAQYSKDTIVLLVVGAVALASRWRHGDAAILATVAVYSYFFRSYWLAIGILYVLFLVVARYRRRPRLALVIGCCTALLVLAMAVYVEQGGESLDIFRMIANAGRENSTDAVTVIKPFLPTGSFVSGYVNSSVVFLFLIIPIPLVLLLSPLYVVSAVFLTFTWQRFLRAYVSLARTAQVNDVVDYAVLTRARRLMAFVMAFWVVQAAYVPDYGSGLKHLTPILPLMVIVLVSAEALQRRTADRSGAVSVAGVTS